MGTKVRRHFIGLAAMGVLFAVVLTPVAQAAKAKPATVAVDGGVTESAYSIGYAGGALYVLRIADGTLLRVTAKGTKLKVKDLGVVAVPSPPEAAAPPGEESGAGFAELDGTVYALLETSAGVQLVTIDPKSGETGSPVAIPGDANGQSLGVAADALWFTRQIEQPRGGASFSVWDIALGSSASGGDPTFGANIAQTTTGGANTVLGVDDTILFTHVGSLSVLLVDATTGTTRTEFDPGTALTTALPGEQVFGASGLRFATGEGAAWMLSTTASGNAALGRIDPVTGDVTATTIPGLQFLGGLAAGEGSVWASTNGTLFRIDPTNVEVEGCVATPQLEGRPLIAVGGKGVWLLDQTSGTVMRLPESTKTTEC